MVVLLEFEVVWYEVEVVLVWWLFWVEVVLYGCFGCVGDEDGV